MWPLPEPARPDPLPDGGARWDPPALVRLALDHGLDVPAPPRPAPAPDRPGRRRPGRG